MVDFSNSVPNRPRVYHAQFGMDYDKRNGLSFLSQPPSRAREGDRPQAVVGVVLQGKNPVNAKNQALYKINFKTPLTKAFFCVMIYVIK